MVYSAQVLRASADTLPIADEICNSMSLKRSKLAVTLLAVPLLVFAPQALSADTGNLTGLPAYPNLSSAVMDGTCPNTKGRLDSGAAF